MVRFTPNFSPFFHSTQFIYVGILTLQPTSRPRSKAEGLVRHQLAMGFGLVCVTLGFSAIVANKNINYSDHFVSAHAVSEIWQINNPK